VAARSQPVGQLLREWRQRRRLSQFDVALDSAVSTRHLSFIETGRARPSREMVLHLADRLEVPLRERNRLLLAAGFAPQFSEHTLEGDELTTVRDALERFLAAHQPYPAIVVDRRWNMLLSNDAVGFLAEGVSPALLEPPANAVVVTLHPDGMAPRIRNLDEWSAHILHRLRRQIELTGDRELVELLEEVASYPGIRDDPALETTPSEEILLPLHLSWRDTELVFFSTMTTFGTALDITLAELAIEAFYPANRETAAILAAA
jgi:transcriptional regulator with XRE-family HTH domain